MPGIARLKTHIHNACSVHLGSHKAPAHINAVTQLAHEALKKTPSVEKRTISAKLFQGDTKEITAIFDRIIVSRSTPWAPNLSQLSTRQETLLQMLRGHIPEIHKERTLLSQIAPKRNVPLLLESRQFVQKTLCDLYAQMTSAPLVQADAFHMETIVGDLLSIYPYLCPVSGEKLKVPIKIDGVYQLVDYIVDEIKLTPSWMGPPLLSYGLHAEDAPPLFIFKGTTFQTDRGAGLGVLTDLNPGASVGGYAFGVAKKTLKHWLDLHTQKHKALLFGKSLGGALAWRTALHFPHKISRVMAYAAPGFSIRALIQLSHLRKNATLPEINLICQKDDHVPFSDLVAPKGVNYYQVLGLHERKGRLAHGDIFSTNEGAMILKLDPAREARRIKRIWLTTVRAIVSILTFAPLLIVHIVHTIAIRSIRSCRARRHRRLLKATK